MRIVIEVKRNESAEVLLNHLYANTAQTVFGINMVALMVSWVFNLKETLNALFFTAVK